ncbi:MAG: DUF1178 family protein [Acetobacteraceae bacterium]|nr:DUF1178 family protein [Acetobacteraceae bacterium]
MIHYTLRCDEGHEFDSWFNSSASFDMQAQRGLLECPHCGSAKVERALMTPSVPRKGRVTAEPVPAKVASPPAVAAEHVPDHIRAMLQKLRSEVEKHCDYVGGAFAAEARRIHNGESDARGIYGETTPEEAEALAEDGIEVARIPWVPRADG